MTSRQLLSSKQLLLAVFLLIFSAPVHAAEQQFLSPAEPQFLSPAEPVGAWQIAKIKTDDATNGRFCSMKNAYSDGSFLVFARDAGNTNSIAFEFPAHNLTVGGTFPIILTVDRFYRETQALAATPRVLVVQVGADDALYNLLAQKDALRMSVAGKEYVFGLKGTAKAFRALDDCAGVVRAGNFAGLPPVFSNVAEGFDPPIGSAPVMRQDIKSFVHVRRPNNQNQTASNASFVTTPANPADMTSKDAEIERLRAENKALQLEKDAADERLRAEAMHKVEIEKALEEQNRREQLQFEEKSRQMETQLREKEAVLEAERRRQQEALQIAEEAARRMEGEKKRFAQETRRLAEAERLAQQRRRAEEDIRRAAAAMPVKGAPPKSLRTTIAEAGIVAGNAIRVDGNALVWQRDDLFGTAEDFPSAPNEALIAAAERYMSDASMQCEGDYAGNLGRETIVAGDRAVIEAEIACINGTNDSAAVLLFVREQGKTSVIINETPAEAVAKALEARGKLLASFSR